MEQIVCKTCGAPNQVESLTGQWHCEWCGNLIELDEDREKFANIYRKADDAWDRKDFDEALRLYEQIVNEDNTQSEAHWGAALCRYGVAYVVDPLHEVKMPTCNRVNRTSIMDDKNYLAAIKYAGPKARAKYEQRAREIDRISKQFLKIVDKEKPYDVFISYKKTGLDGRMTLDSQYARKLYHYLTDKGIKVFFAEETLAEVAGSMYEPYIFAALTSAKVMVLMGSRKEHFEAVWVKNEWRRFLALAESDPSKVLIPAYINCKPEDELPMGLNLVQAMDATGMVFLEDVTAIVKKKMGAAPQAAKAGNLNLLSEKYATKANVDRVVNALDCEPELAAEVLIIHQGKVDNAIRYISSSADYQKALWTCAECGTKNTHDVCRNPDCGLTKAAAAKVAQMRAEAKRREEEQRRKEEEQRRREYERSAEAKRIRAEKRSRAMGRFVAVLIVLAILAGIGYGIYALITKVIQPAIYEKADADSFYSPEILQTYTGTYRSSSGDMATALLTFEECSQDGKVTGVLEFILEGEYGKYTVNGTITKRQNNGRILMDLTAGQWIVQPSNYSFLDEIVITITEGFTKVSGNKYNFQTSAGSDTEFDIKSASDLNKLSNADGLFILKSDIDLAGQSWKPIEGFTGTLVGNGYTIKNMTIEASGDNVGFFATLSGFVSNVNFENATVNVSGRHQNVGILAGCVDGIVADVTVSGTVTAEMCSYVGGVVGLMNRAGTLAISNMESAANVSGNEMVGGIFGGLMDQPESYTDYTVTLGELKNSGQITGAGTYVGGIAGYLYVEGRGGNAEITLFADELTNTGAITGKQHVGGIFGVAFSDNTASYMQDCSSNAAVTGEAYVGGLAGQLAGITMNHCSNAGATVTATGYVTSEGEKYAFVGGYVGFGYLANDCANAVQIQYTGGGKYVGGIMGYTDAWGTYESKNLENTANISGADCVGGIFGGLVNTPESYTDYTVTLSGMKNSGAITGTGSYAGGIAGYLYVEGRGGNAEITLFADEMTSTGAVTGKQHVGGIFGYAFSDSAASYMQDCSCSGAVTGEAYVGALAGQLSKITLNSCSNLGATITATGYVTLDGVKYAYVGGYVGYGYLANDCTNTVNIDYTGGGAYVGGIMGYTDAWGTYEMKNLENTANISGRSHVGGIIGGLLNKPESYTDYSATINNMKNSGKVTGSGNYVGGIIGYLELEGRGGNAEITLYSNAMSNTGAVKGGKYVGGIFGYAKSDSSNSAVSDITSTGSVSGTSNYSKNAGYAEKVTFQ